MKDTIHPLALQVVAIGATSAASSTFQPATLRVQMTATVACWVSFTGAAVANTAGSMYIPADTPIEVVVPSVPSGTALNIAGRAATVNVIQAASGGYLSVVESA